MMVVPSIRALGAVAEPLQMKLLLILGWAAWKSLNQSSIRGSMESEPMLVKVPVAGAAGSGA